MLEEKKSYSRQVSSTSGVDSFVLAEHEQYSKEQQNHDLSAKFKIGKLVDDIIAERVNLEACADCNKQIITELQARIGKVEDDTNAFRTAIDAFGQDDEDDTDEDTLLNELDKLKAEETSLHKKLEMAEKEYVQTRLDISNLKHDVKKLNEEETNLEREYATLKAELASLEEEKKSHDLEARSMESHLRKLKNLNPLAAAFHISKSKGKYGVINGLRLGKMDNDDVMWEEISAALGQVALLTKIIIEKATFTIEKYTIHPLGARSFIMEKNGTRHPLYRQQTLGTKLGLGDKAFDNGLSAYSEIMAQLKELLSKRGTKLPYNIECGQIQETNGSNLWYTVKFSSSSGEEWLTAMRLLLTNLKWARDGITENF